MLGVLTIASIYIVTEQVDKEYVQFKVIVHIDISGYTLFYTSLILILILENRRNLVVC